MFGQTHYISFLFYHLKAVASKFMYLHNCRINQEIMLCDVCDYSW